MDSHPTLLASVQRDLETLDDNGDFLPGLIDEFELDLEQALKSLQQCHRSKDGKGFRDACHSIKSLAGHLGASHLSELGKTGMTFTTDDLKTPHVGQWFALMDAAQADAVAALRHWMTQYQASLDAH